MIFDKVTGQRIFNTHEAYKTIVAKLKEAYPGFLDGTQTIHIEAKKHLFKRKEVYTGKSQEDAKHIRTGEFPPPKQILTETGTYIDKNGNKVDVIFSRVSPTIDPTSRVPVWPHVEPEFIQDGKPLSKDDLDFVVFLYGMKPEVDGGMYKNDAARHEFAHPEEKARTRRSKSIEFILQEEIMFEGTCMVHEDIKKIMEILNLPLTVSEDLNRTKLYDYVVALPSKEMYEKAKTSVVSKKKSADPVNISKAIKEAKGKGLLFINESTGMWELKKSDILTVPVTQVIGGDQKEKDINLGEFYTLNPSAFEELTSLLK